MRQWLLKTLDSLWNELGHSIETVHHDVPHVSPEKISLQFATNRQWLARVSYATNTFGEVRPVVESAHGTTLVASQHSRRASDAALETILALKGELECYVRVDGLPPSSYRLNHRIATVLGAMDNELENGNVQVLHEDEDASPQVYVPLFVQLQLPRK